MTPRSVARTITFLSCLALVPSFATARHAVKPDNDVLQWNTAMSQAIGKTGFSPVFTARGFAILHTCMHDAWAASDDVAVGTRLGGQLRQPASARSRNNRQKAVSYAACAARTDLFPSDRAGLFDPLTASVGYDISASATDPVAAVRHLACGAVLEFRHGDGANQLGDLNGGLPYSDYTDYLPINDPDAITDPSRWQPLRNANGTTQVFLAPHLGRVTPFAPSSPG
jgi:hypothetical protein